jgi:hypothetical protein
MPTKEPVEPGKFEVLFVDACLSDAKALESRDKLIYGDVARLADGRVFCRLAGRDVDGTVVYGFDRFELEPLIRKGVNPDPDCPAKRFARDLQNLREPSGIAEVKPTDFRAAARDFAEVWKQLYPKFTLFDDYPIPLFGTGTFYRRCQERCLEVSWLQCRIHQHTFGEFGIFGKADLKPLSTEEEWGTGLLDLARQNSAAIIRGVGEVVSHFPLEDRKQAEWKVVRPEIEGRPERAILEIRSVLRPSGNKSLCRVISSLA